MVNPLQYLEVEMHPLGAEMILTWGLPETTPENWVVWIFKRDNSAIPQSVIDDYVANQTVPNDVSVIEATSPVGAWDNQITEQVIVNDAEKRNVNEPHHYYYKAVLVDADTIENAPDVSSALAADAEASNSYTEISNELKTVIMDAIEELLRKFEMVRDAHYSLYRIFQFNRSDPLEIVVSRTSIDTATRLWGDALYQDRENTEYGQINKAVFQVIWKDPYMERVDRLTQLFENGQVALRHILSDDTNILDANFSFTGDGVDNQWRDHAVYFSGMSILLDTKSGLITKNRERRGAPVSMASNFS